MERKEQPPTFDPNADTQPYWLEESVAATQPIPQDDPMGRLQPIRIPKKIPAQRRKLTCGGWGLLPVLLAGLLITVYFFAPLRTNVLLLGIDRTPPGTALGRTDTIILVSVTPLKPTVRMLAIPRDLYLPIHGVGEDRINTVHFFAEAERPGSGPAALIRLIREQFKVPMRHYVRIRFDGFVGVVDAMGGVVIVLQKPMGSYPAGRHHLQGEQALAFVRDRRGTDDFFRMQQAQVFIQAAVLQTISPANWVRLPTVVRTTFESLDSNIPFWQFPRLGLALVRASLTGIDSYTLDRTMVIPYMTTGGAQVLLPQWERIRPLVAKIFGP